jgi:hypothetical protein
MLPESLRQRLWQEADGQFAYAVLDGAQNPQLLDALEGPDAPPFRCLLAGDLAPDMAEVAPYLVQLAPGSPFTEALLARDWSPHWGILLVAPDELGPVWRHLRQHVQVYGPDLSPLYFRFYDPRVLRNFLPTCSAGQLAEFFGPISRFYSEAEAGRPVAGLAWSLAGGQLVCEEVLGR